MRRLRVLSGREACRILAAHGFREVRRRGSHIIMQRLAEAGTITVPVPDHRELRLGTLHSIIRPGRDLLLEIAAGRFTNHSKGQAPQHRDIIFSCLGSARSGSNCFAEE